MHVRLGIGGDDDDDDDVLVLGVHMYAVIDVYLISKLPSGVNIIVTVYPKKVGYLRTF